MIKTYGKRSLITQNKIIHIKNKFFIKNKSSNFYDTYGKCIRLSYGLILGLFIDKILLYITKGLSILIPPFSGLLMKKGRVLYEIRFDKKFGKLNKIINHLCWKE